MANPPRKTYMQQTGFDMNRKPDPRQESKYYEGEGDSGMMQISKENNGPEGFSRASQASDDRIPMAGQESQFSEVPTEGGRNMMQISRETNVPAGFSGGEASDDRIPTSGVEAYGMSAAHTMVVSEPRIEITGVSRTRMSETRSGLLKPEASSDTQNAQSFDVGQLARKKDLLQKNTSTAVPPPLRSAPLPALSPLDTTYRSTDYNRLQVKALRAPIQSDVDAKTWSKRFEPAYDKLKSDGDARALDHTVKTFEELAEQIQTKSGWWDSQDRVRVECLRQEGVCFWRQRAFHVAVLRLKRALELCYDDGVVYLHLALARAPVDMPERTSAKFHDLSRAFDLFERSGDWRQAGEIIRIATRLNPKDPVACYARGFVDLKMLSFDEAGKHFSLPIRDRLDSSGHDYSFLYYLRGLSMNYIGDYIKAMKDFTRALRLDPTHANALSARAWANADKPDYQMALKDLQLRADLTDSPQSHAELGRVCLLADMPQESYEAYDRAITLEPFNGLFYAERCLCLRELVKQKRLALRNSRDAQLESEPRWSSLMEQTDDDNTIRQLIKRAEHDAIITVALDSPDSFCFMDRVNPLSVAVYSEMHEKYHKRQSDSQDVILGLTCAVALYGMRKYADALSLCERSIESDLTKRNMVNVFAKLIGLMCSAHLERRFMNPKGGGSARVLSTEWDDTVLNLQFHEHYNALVHDRHGLEELRLGQSRTAVSHFTDAIRTQTQLSPIVAPVAKALRNSKAYAQSKPRTQPQELELLPLPPSAHAHAHLTRVVPYHAAFHDHRGRAYEMAGDFARALLDYEFALAVDPTHPVFAASRTRMWTKLYAHCNSLVHTAPHPRQPAVDAPEAVAILNALSHADRIERLTVHQALLLLFEEKHPLRYSEHCTPDSSHPAQAALPMERAQAAAAAYPVTFAVRTQQLAYIQELVLSRGQPQLQDLALALCCAAYTDDVVYVKEVLRIINAADCVNMRTEDGRSPLFFAAYNGNRDVVNSLLDAQADVFARDMHGRTAMHYAAMNNQVSVMGALRHAGAHALIYDRAEKRPCDYALERGHFELGRQLTHFCTVKYREAQNDNRLSAPLIPLSQLPVESSSAAPTAKPQEAELTTEPEVKTAELSELKVSKRREPWVDALPFHHPTVGGSIYLPEDYGNIDTGHLELKMDLALAKKAFNIHMLREVSKHLPHHPDDQNLLVTTYARNFYVYQKPLEGLTASSQFPTPEFKDYVEFLLKRHSRAVDRNSPIVQALQYSVVPRNVLRPHAGIEEKEKARLMNLVADMCHVQAFPLSVVKVMKCLPSILWRLEFYLLVHELRGKTDLNIRFDRLQTAITSASAQEKESYERLEFLGDSFLKWAVSVYLYDRFERESEEQLTIRRSRYVGNSSLYGRAKAKNIHRYINANPFNPKTWQPPGFPLNAIDAENQTNQVLSPKLIADSVEAIIGAAYVSGGILMAKAVMAWLKLPSDLTLSKESQTEGVISDQDGPLPTHGKPVNRHHEQERDMAYKRSRDLIKMEVLKGARLTLISEIREVRKQLETNTRQGQLLRNQLSRDGDRLRDMEKKMKDLGLAIPHDSSGQYVGLGASTGVSGPVLSIGRGTDTHGNDSATRYPFVSWPHAESFAHASAAVTDGAIAIDMKDDTSGPSSSSNNSLVRKFLALLAVVHGEQHELDSNTNRGVMLLSNLRRLEDEVQLVDRMREHAEKNDLMNAAAKSSAALEEKKSDRPKDGGRHDTFSIIKAHRYPDQKYLYLVHSMDEIEKRLGYTFNDKLLLVQALTHGSYVYAEGPTYQRLEFLGDAILEFMVTRQMYENYPYLSPGDLTLLRQKLVCNLAFGTACIKGNLHKYLMHYSPAITHAVNDYLREVERYRKDIKRPDVDVTEVSPPDPPKVLGDVFEAFIGAAFLDCKRKLTVVWNIYRRLTQGPSVVLELMNDPKLGIPDLRHAPHEPSDVTDEMYDEPVAKLRLPRGVDAGPESKLDFEY